uniref:30S ribosomal protein S11 n=1 Tax=Meloidogyne hapla TaxID=6305 RepID=A0A1I8B9R2_MELHA
MKKKLRSIYTSICRQNDKEGEGNKLDENKNESNEKSISDLLSGEGFFMPFKTEVTPEKVPHHHYKHWEKSKRVITRDLPTLDILEKEEIEGTTGSSTLLSIATSRVDEQMPSLSTMKQLFGGIPYERLPIVVIIAKYTNTKIAVTDHQGVIICNTSAGIEGFKHAKKKTTLAGQATGAAAAARMIRRGIRIARVVVKGIGPGRMTAVKGLATGGIQVVSITDRTPLPELGPRPRKIRRV